GGGPDGGPVRALGGGQEHVHGPAPGFLPAPGGQHHPGRPGHPRPGPALAPGADRLRGPGARALRGDHQGECGVRRGRGPRGRCRAGRGCGRRPGARLRQGLCVGVCACIYLGFPRGWETDVGEKSSLLSGGQKQRLAIARAILKSPKILLLDEATSALDNENEKLVQAALDDLQRGGRFTTLVIAHRLSTIQGANSIAVVSGGQVKQLGTHEALMKEESGLYRQLVQAAERGGGGGNKAKVAATVVAVDGEEASPSPKG
ncbi:unnamed protein product, partial [Heterosigma akashiwo]